MKENIWYEFQCPYCDNWHKLGHAEYVGVEEIQHYNCHNGCKRNFYFKLDFDNRIHYIEEKDL